MEKVGLSNHPNSSRRHTLGTPRTSKVAIVNSLTSSSADPSRRIDGQALETYHKTTQCCVLLCRLACWSAKRPGGRMLWPHHGRFRVTRAHGAGGGVVITR